MSVQLTEGSVGKNLLERKEDTKKMGEEEEGPNCGYAFHKSQVTPSLIDGYNLALKEANQYYDFLNYLRHECKFIKRDSNAEEIFGRLPLERFDFLRKGFVIELLYEHIFNLQEEYRERQLFQFSLHLTKCDYIKYDSIPDDILQKLRVDPNSTNEDFLNLDSSMLIDRIDEYILHLRAMMDLPYVRAMMDLPYVREVDYMELVERRLHRSLLAFINRPFPRWSSLPIYNLAYRVHFEGYVMNADLAVEIAKILQSVCVSCEEDRDRNNTPNKPLDLWASPSK